MPQGPAQTMDARTDRARRYREVADLLHKWMTEDDGYDDESWAIVEKEIQDTTVRRRQSDEPST